MENIKISNFRKIQDEWSLDLAPVTFFTGTNNSGKSTIFKALLLFEDYVKSDNHFQLNFNANNSRKHKIDSYSNAFNRLNMSNSKLDLKFAYSNRGHRISLIFKPKEFDDESTISAGKLKRLEVIRDSDGSSLVMENTAVNDYIIMLDNSFLDDLNSNDDKEKDKNIIENELNKIEEEIKEIQIKQQRLKDQKSINESYHSGYSKYTSYDLGYPFKKYLLKFYQEKSGTPKSYMSAINLISKKVGYDIFHETDIDKINILYNDLLVEQKIEGGKYFDDSSPSYGMNGFYSASIKKYMGFLDTYISKVTLNELREEHFVPKSISREEIDLASTLKKYKQRRNYLANSNKYLDDSKSKKTVLMPEFSLDDFHGGILKIDTVIRKILPNYLKENQKKIGRSSEKNEFEKAANFGDYLLQVMQFSVDHLSPHRNIQTKLYINSDNETDINEVINEHSLNQISKASKAGKFIKEWMVKFDIGQDFKIKQIEGLASQIIIKEGRQNINLADKGFGAGQIFTILLKIALVIDLKEDIVRTIQKGLRRQGFEEFTNLILIEEPEANLHPALQSKLADLFYEVYKKFEIRFIIETHSEYLIRKSQVYVKEHFEKSERNESGTMRLNKALRELNISLDAAVEELAKKGFEIESRPTTKITGIEYSVLLSSFSKTDLKPPFSVYYFDGVKGPYNMEYDKQGKFINDFGNGFFDVSRKLTRKLL